MRGWNWQGWLVASVVTLLCARQSLGVGDCEGTWLEPFGSTDGVVRAFAIWDDGTRPALYIGGEFTGVSGIPARSVARWDGTTWQALGAGVDLEILALAVYQGELVAAGGFTIAGDLPASRLARWSGTSW